MEVKIMINYKLKKVLSINIAFIVVGIIFYLVADDYLLYVATSWLIFGILGLSLDLIWGKAGILSLGQTIFYGLGGYAGAVVAINFSSYFGNTFLLAIPVGLIVGALIAGLVGVFIFYGRMGELQVTILTYTLVLLCWTSAITYSFAIGKAVIGGDNGLSNIPSMALSTVDGELVDMTEKGMYLSLLLISIILLICCQKLIKSPFGKIIECIRQDAQKTELLGYDIRKYQTLLFIVSGAIAGVGGSLFALWGNYLNPSIFSVSEALLVPIYVLVGGLGTLIGPFLGALAIGALSFFLGSFSGGEATLVIGIMLILMVLFFDKGIVGIIA
ncbi:MAG: branched-chain amino acid ABC transporter permease, partial [Polaribacter sp.]